MVPSTFTVLNVNDTGSGSLRQAILDSNAAGGANFILFSTGLTGPLTISLKTALPDLMSNVDIEGPGADKITVQRSAVKGTPSFSVFTVDSGFTDTIAGLTISNGLAAEGGGVNNQGHLTLQNDAITGNTATDSGGGVINGSHATPAAGTPTLMVISSEISTNTTAKGGRGAAGIDSEQGSVTITNSTISGNTSVSSNSTGGVGVYDPNALGATATIQFSTIANNTASGTISGGGIDAEGSLPVVLFDTIVATNSGGNGADVRGAFNSSGHNLIGVADAASTGLTGAGDQVGSKVTPIDPKLGALMNNGGPTSTQAPQTGSPAIDAGSNTGAPAADQRGYTPRIVNNKIDIGAYEVGAAAPAAPTPGTVQFKSATFNTNENAGTVTITVKRTGGSSGVISVQYATSDGTGIAGTDYGKTTGTLTWTAGDTADKTFTVPILDAPSGAEANETVALTLSNPTQGATLGGQNTAVLTIAEVAPEDSDTPPPPPPPPAGPPSTPPLDTFQQQFVAKVFQDVLHRAPEQGVLAAYVAALNNGVTHAQVAASIEFGTEHLQGEVNAIYVQILHRAVDPAGLNAWTGFLAAGNTPTQLRAILLGSPEYFQFVCAGSNDGFLVHLYRDALGHEIDTQALIAGRRALALGASRASVVQIIVGSLEYRFDLAENLYSSLLRRPADPAGLNAVEVALLGGVSENQIAVILIGSPEYFTP